MTDLMDKDGQIDSIFYLVYKKVNEKGKVVPILLVVCVE